MMIYQYKKSHKHNKPLKSAISRLLIFLVFFVCSCQHVFAAHTLPSLPYDEAYDRINQLVNQGKVTTGLVGRLALIQDTYAHSSQFHDFLSAVRHYAADTVFALDLQTGDTYLGHKYYRRGGQVFFDDYPVQGADAASFMVVAPSYAFDRECAYWHHTCFWWLLDAQWEWLGSYYSRYATSIYWKDQLLDADALSFRRIDDNYAIDNQSVFFGGNIMNYDAQSFRVIGDGYTADAQGVYYNNVLVFSDFERFERLGNHYARYDDTIYRYHQVQPYDADSFRVINEHYVGDSRGVYFLYALLPDSSLETFEILDYPFAKDAGMVYEREQQVPRLHAKSFSVVDVQEGLIRDKFGLYKWGQWYDGSLYGKVINKLRRLRTSIFY